MMKKTFWCVPMVLLLVLCCGFASGEVRAYFKFDNIKGNSFTDDTGKGLIGTLGVSAGAGAPTSVAGPSGISTDKAILIPRGEGLIVDDSAFQIFEIFAPRTIELWVKAPAFTMTESMAAIVSYGLDSGYRISVLQTGNIVYSLMGVQDFDTGYAFPFDDLWHHLAVVDDLDMGEVRVYLDGAVIFSTPSSVDNAVADYARLFIGRSGTTPNYLAFEGSIDRLRISNSALSLEELDTDAANEKAVTDSTLALFDFNETTVPYVSQGVETCIAVTLKDFTSGTAGAPEVVTDTPSGVEGDYSLYFSDGAQCSVNDPNKVMDVGGTGNNWTIEAWVKYPDGDFTDRKIIFYYGPGGISFSLSGNNPRRVFVTTLRIADFSSTSAEVTPDEWHHVAVVHQDGVSLSFFVDGELIEEDPYTSGTRNADVNVMNIGSEPNGVMPITGWIDRIRVSDTALTAAELDSNPTQPTWIGEWSVF